MVVNTRQNLILYFMSPVYDTPIYGDPIHDFKFVLMTYLST
jgi:hypothetical protein